MSDLVVQASRLSRTYARELGPPVRALEEVDLELERGEYLGIVGASGSGKSTLLHLLGLLDRASSGSLVLDGRDVSELGDRELSRERGRRIGFVFQTFNLVSELDVLDNVLLPALYGEVDERTARDRARAAVERVGLGQRATHRPTELSGGEQQRVAIARAIVGRPSLLLADEPTGNLDSRTGGEILDLFGELHAEGATLVVVTHDDDVAARTDRTLRLKDGRIEGEERRR